MILLPWLFQQLKKPLKHHKRLFYVVILCKSCSSISRIPKATQVRYGATLVNMIIAAAHQLWVTHTITCVICALFNWYFRYSYVMGVFVERGCMPLKRALYFMRGTRHYVMTDYGDRADFTAYYDRLHSNPDWAFLMGSKRKDKRTIPLQTKPKNEKAWYKSTFCSDSIFSSRFLQFKYLLIYSNQDKSAVHKRFQTAVCCMHFPRYHVYTKRACSGN